MWHGGRAGLRKRWRRSRCQRGVETPPAERPGWKDVGGRHPLVGAVSPAQALRIMGREAWQTLRNVALGIGTGGADPFCVFHIRGGRALCLEVEYRSLGLSCHPVCPDTIPPHGHFHFRQRHPRAWPAGGKVGALEAFGWREGARSTFQPVGFSPLTAALLLGKNLGAPAGSQFADHPSCRLGWWKLNSSPDSPLPGQRGVWSGVGFPAALPGVTVPHSRTVCRGAVDAVAGSPRVPRDRLALILGCIRD